MEGGRTHQLGLVLALIPLVFPWMCPFRKRCCKTLLLGLGPALSPGNLHGAGTTLCPRRRRSRAASALCNHPRLRPMALNRSQAA